MAKHGKYTTGSITDHTGNTLNIVTYRVEDGDMAAEVDPQRNSNLPQYYYGHTGTGETVGDAIGELVRLLRSAAMV